MNVQTPPRFAQAEGFGKLLKTREVNKAFYTLSPALHRGKEPQAGARFHVSLRLVGTAT